MYIYIGFILLLNCIHSSKVELLPKDKCKEFCDENGGVCNTTTLICKCKYNYASFHNDYIDVNLNGNDTINNNKFCNYAKTSKLKSAFIEIIFGFGTGHLYSQRKLNGFLKLITYSFSFCCCCCLMILSAKIDTDNIDENQTFLKISTFLFLMCYCILIIWQIIDFVLFICGVYVDGNGIELY